MVWFWVRGVYIHLMAYDSDSQNFLTILVENDMTDPSDTNRDDEFYAPLTAERVRLLGDFFDHLEAVEAQAIDYTDTRFVDAIIDIVSEGIGKDADAFMEACPGRVRVRGVDRLYMCDGSILELSSEDTLTATISGYRVLVRPRTDANDRQAPDRLELALVLHGLAQRDDVVEYPVAEDDVLMPLSDSVTLDAIYRDADFADCAVSGSGKEAVREADDMTAEFTRYGSQFKALELDMNIGAVTGEWRREMVRLLGHGIDIQKGAYRLTAKVAYSHNDRALTDVHNATMTYRATSIVEMDIADMITWRIVYEFYRETDGAPELVRVLPEDIVQVRKGN